MVKVQIKNTPFGAKKIKVEVLKIPDVQSVRPEISRSAYMVKLSQIAMVVN